MNNRAELVFGGDGPSLLKLLIGFKKPPDSGASENFLVCGLGARLCAMLGVGDLEMISEPNTLFVDSTEYEFCTDMEVGVVFSGNALLQATGGVISTLTSNSTATDGRLLDDAAFGMPLQFSLVWIEFLISVSSKLMEMWKIIGYEVAKKCHDFIIWAS